jgi:hypothetical protein
MLQVFAAVGYALRATPRATGAAGAGNPALDQPAPPGHRLTVKQERLAVHIEPPELAEFLERRRHGGGASPRRRRTTRADKAADDAAKYAADHVAWKARRGEFVPMVEVARLIEHNTAVLLRPPRRNRPIHRLRSDAWMERKAREIAARKRRQGEGAE